jgi:hypothetical protein
LRFNERRGLKFPAQALDFPCDRFDALSESPRLMAPRRTPPHDLTVVPHRPDRERRLIAMAVVAVLAAALIGFWGGREQSAETRDAALARLDALAARHRTLVIEHDRLRSELGDARLAREMEVESSGVVRETINDQAARIASLEDEVRFYRSLMAREEDSDEVLRIADLELLRRLDGPGVRFRLLLVRPADPGDEVEGHVELRVVGRRGGETQVLTGAALGSSSAEPIPFRFRYFQNVAGEIELPEGFVPAGVEVVAQAEGQGGVRLQRTFSWQVQEV